MRFLIDADLPRSAGDIARRHGYETVDVRDIGLRTTKDPKIAQYAQTDGLCLISGDYGFADIRNYPPDQYAGIVVLYVPSTATATYINALLESFEHKSSYFQNFLASWPSSNQGVSGFEEQDSFISLINMLIKTKRIYAKPGTDDGARILVDRLWPRGLRKRFAHAFMLEDWQ
jgi:predicted nuclease of predicted toxin-antitoxin system